MHICKLQKRRRAAALHNAKRLTALRTARSVLDCASPLALFHPTGPVPQAELLAQHRQILIRSQIFSPKRLAAEPPFTAISSKPLEPGTATTRPVGTD